MVNNNPDFQDDPYSIEAYLNALEEEMADDPIPDIIQQLGIYERFVLHRYKNQKLVYADYLSYTPMIW